MPSAVSERPASKGSPATPSSRQILQPLRNLLETNRRRWKGLVAVQALALAVAAPVGYFWAVILLDELVPLPLVGRVLASLGLVAGIVWALGYLQRQLKHLHFSEDQVALAMEERTTGGVQNRLINAVQLARTPDPNSPELNEAVIEENVSMLQQYHLEQAARQRPALIRLGLALAVVLFGVGMWIWHPDRFSNAAVRILLPLANIDPVYDTKLSVQPGDTEGVGDIALTIAIEGTRPRSLILYRTVQGKRSSEVIAVAGGQAPVSYMLKDVLVDTDYSVRGGDFTTPTYRITVPRRAGFSRLRVTYTYPEYTGLAPKNVESVSGELEALQGTRAQLTFQFDKAVQDVKLVPVKLKSVIGEPVALQGENGTFNGELVLDGVQAYQLEVALAGKSKADVVGPYSIRLLKDQEPRLDLLGLERRMEVPIEAVLPVKVQATDDFGLDTVGVFYRPVLSGDIAAAADQEKWLEIATWPGKKQTKFVQEHQLKMGTFPWSEGDKIEVTARGKDTNPHATGWTTGPIYELTLGGEGAALQIQYEQILRSEKDLRALLKQEEDVTAKVTTWLRKLEGAGDLRWDDPKNIAMLHEAVKDIGVEQSKLRLSTTAIARAMLPQTGNMRLGVSMLADTEMDRVLRILDAVPVRDNPQAKRAALADARVTLERIGRSLQDINEQHATFRADWELANMIPFTKMLAGRQTKLRDQAKALAAKNSDNAQSLAHQRRQTKVLDLVKLIQPVLGNLSERLHEEEKLLSTAFAEGSKILASDGLHQNMIQAAAQAGAARWADAVPHETRAAEQLHDVYQKLRQAQIETTRLALAKLKEKAKSDLEAQKELENLPPGTAEVLVKDYPHDLKLEDTIRLREVAGATKRKDKDGEDDDFKKALTTDLDPKRVTLDKDSGVRQDTDTLTLGKVAEKTAVLDMWKSDGRNKVKPFIQEQFDDLVGKLLDETEELGKKYQSITMSTNQNNNDPGDIGKNGGALSSTGAVAATGNKKPPTTEGGGVAKTGFQGARAFGMVADKEGVDRRGRDKALDGMEQAPDQAGSIKNKKSDDTQQDFSSGIGGKKVESDDTHFSLHDAGKWKDDMAKRMEKAQKKQYIVERQGDKFDARMASQLRDLESKQEQIIERLKAIKKELKNLYLPTDHLDELMNSLQTNLERLRERPDVEMFRLQMQTLDRLRGAVRVFRTASSNFQPSLPRERMIRGRVLDEPAAPTLPGYEEAVRTYYLKLADQ